MRASSREIAIEARGVVKSFEKRRVLNGLDLQVEKGESVVILGFSGSGKSVLLKHLTGYLEPDQGRIEVLGKDWTRLSDDEKQRLRSRFGIVFQNAALFDSLSLEQNLTLPLQFRAKSNGYQTFSVRRDALRYLAEVGLSEADAQRLPLEISGGMQKRVAIARALAMEPDLVFYDEPTTGLDPQTGEKISRLIRTVHDARQGTTSYTITHDYLCAAMIADRVLYLDKRTGTLTEVLSRDDLQGLRRTAGDQAVRAIQDRLEAFIRSRKQAAEEELSHGPRLRLITYLKEEAAHFVETLGALVFLFLEMGTPLRSRDFVDRLFSAGVHSFPLMLGAGFFVGMTGMVQFYTGVGSYKEILPVSLPGTLTSAMLEIISPLLVGVLLAGRVGANITTEIGAKGLMSQIDALESLAISPKRFLLAPIVWALAIAAPLMTLLATFAGVVGGLVMWLSFGEPISEFWHATSQSLGPVGICYAMGKSAVTGVLVGLVGYQQGTQRIRGTDDIAAAATRTVLICAILVVISDFLLSFIYTRGIG